MRHGFNLHLVFAAKGAGDYLADVAVKVKNARGRPPAQAAYNRCVSLRSLADSRLHGTVRLVVAERDSAAIAKTTAPARVPRCAWPPSAVAAAVATPPCQGGRRARLKPVCQRTRACLQEPRPGPTRVPEPV